MEMEDDKLYFYDNQDLSSYGQYLREISFSVETLTKEEQRALFEEYARTKDIEIRNKIVENNLRLVPYTVAKFFGNVPNVPKEDLVMFGNFGLIRAVEKYDLNISVEFSTYAVIWIRQAVMRRMHEERLIKLPVYLIDVFNAIRRHENMWMQKHSAAPTPEELIEFCINSPDFPATSIKHLTALDEMDFSRQIYQNKYVWLDQIVNEPDGGQTPMMNLIQDYDVDVEAEGVASSLHKLVKKEVYEILAPRDADIVAAKFGIDGKGEKTLEKVGEMHNISKERTRQIIDRALRKLKQHSKLRLHNGSKDGR